MTRHRHTWALCAPIDPVGDPGAVAARAAHAYSKTVHYACPCGGSKMELSTGGYVNRYITRANGRLWRGRRRQRGRRYGGPVGQGEAGRARRGRLGQGRLGPGEAR